MNSRIILTLMVAFSSFSLLAEQPAAKGRGAWQWSLEERLAARFDPASIRERQAARESSSLVRQSDSTPVDGRRNPELLLPFEVFNQFLQVLKTPAEVRAQVREHYRPQIAQAKWDYDRFWREVDAAALPYQAAEASAVRLQQQGTALSETERRSASTAVCAARAAALNALRASLGAEAFDRFLYTAVAPHMKTTTRATMDAAQLKRIEAGCK